MDQGASAGGSALKGNVAGKRHRSASLGMCALGRCALGRCALGMCALRCCGDGRGSDYSFPVAVAGYFFQTLRRSQQLSQTLTGRSMVAQPSLKG